MSSISAADRKNQTDDLRAQREEIQDREAEEAKRHKKEIKRLVEQQDKEVNALKEHYSGRIDTLLQKTNEQLTERDQENLAKIDKLRSMYLESLKRKTEEAEVRRTADSDSYKDQVTKQRQVSDQQKDQLVRNFDNTIQNKDQQFYELSQGSREEMKNAISSQSDKQIRQRNAEVKNIVEDRDRRIMEKDRNFDETRLMYENRLKDTKQLGDENLQRTNNNWEQTYKTKTGEMNELLSGKNDQLKLETERLQGRYANTVNDKLKTLDDARESLRVQGTERIDREVRSLESENARLKSNHSVDVATTKRIRDLEREHIVQDYETRMGKLEETKDGQLEVGKEVNRRNIERASNKNDDVLNESNRRNRTEMIITNERHKEAQDVLQAETKGQVRHLEDRTENRVNKIMKATTEAQRVEQKQHGETMGAMKDSYAEELANQRLAQMEQLKDTYNRMDEKVKGSQEKFTQKLDETVNAYETRIAEMEDRNKKEMQRLADNLENRAKAKDKAQQMEIKASETKTDLKLGSMQESHERELDRVQRRHQEEMASLAQKLSYYRKNNT